MKKTSLHILIQTFLSCHNRCLRCTKLLFCVRETLCSRTDGCTRGVLSMIIWCNMHIIFVHLVGSEPNINFISMMKAKVNCVTIVTTFFASGNEQLQEEILLRWLRAIFTALIVDHEMRQLRKSRYHLPDEIDQTLIWKEIRHTCFETAKTRCQLSQSIDIERFSIFISWMLQNEMQRCEIGIDMRLIRQILPFHGEMRHSWWCIQQSSGDGYAFSSIEWIWLTSTFGDCIYCQWPATSWTMTWCDLDTFLRRQSYIVCSGVTKGWLG